MRDPVTGEPTGILKESAMELIKTGAVKIDMSPEEHMQKEWLGYITALRQAAEYGITSIQIPGIADFGMYDSIMAEGMLTCRIDIGAELTRPDLRRGTVEVKNIQGLVGDRGNVQQVIAAEGHAKIVPAAARQISQAHFPLTDDRAIVRINWKQPH